MPTRQMHHRAIKVITWIPASGIIAVRSLFWRLTLVAAPLTSTAGLSAAESSVIAQGSAPWSALRTYRFGSARAATLTGLHAAFESAAGRRSHVPSVVTKC